MFANAAQDHEQAEEAVMASPVISGIPNFCFEFYFDLKVIWISEYLIEVLRARGHQMKHIHAVSISEFHGYLLLEGPYFFHNLSNS